MAQKMLAVEDDPAALRPASRTLEFAVNGVESPLSSRTAPAGHASILTLPVNSQNADRAKGEEAGADLHATKPTTPEKTATPIHDLPAQREGRSA